MSQNLVRLYKALGGGWEERLSAYEQAGLIALEDVESALVAYRQVQLPLAGAH